MSSLSHLILSGFNHQLNFKKKNKKKKTAPFAGVLNVKNRADIMNDQVIIFSSLSDRDWHILPS